MKLAVATAASLVVLVAASAAEAAQRYAAAAGVGESCTKEEPCSLREALTKASGDDEVIVTGGTYSLGTVPIAMPPTTKGAFVHGDFAGRPPLISASAMFSAIGFAEGVRAAYLDFVNSTPVARGFSCEQESLIERVRVTAVGSEAIGVLQGGSCLVRDSLIRADGPEAIAISAAGTDATGILRNVTAVATGIGSVGISSRFSSGGGAYTLDVRNVIGSGEAVDLKAVPGIAPGRIVVSNSNFDTFFEEGEASVTEGTGNQSAPPHFVDAARGDYREAAGSPTIDAGSIDRIGALDLEGNSRTLGPAPDIGAFELVPGPTAAGGVQSIVIRPRKFRARRAGGAVSSGLLKGRPPVGSQVTYTLTGPATVSFGVSRAIRGRIVGGKCKRKSRANVARRKCTFFKPVKGGFSLDGGGGENRFTFSGRIGGRALKPGRYKLSAAAGRTLKSAAFTIVG
jgi:hypothetical protein